MSERGWPPVSRPFLPGFLMTEFFFGHRVGLQKSSSVVGGPHNLLAGWSAVRLGKVRCGMRARKVASTTCPPGSKSFGLFWLGFLLSQELQLFCFCWSCCACCFECCVPQAAVSSFLPSVQQWCAIPRSSASCQCYPVVPLSATECRVYWFPAPRQKPVVCNG